MSGNRYHRRYMAVLGVDIGTTSAKAIAFTTEGRRLAAAQEEYALIRPKPGYYELDSPGMLAAVGKVIGAVCTEVGRGKIRAIACSALGEAVLPVDADGNPLGNTVLALDHRATDQARALAESIAPEEFFRITGQALHPIASICKILWWREHEPELFARTRRFLCWNEMLALHLGVRPAISPSLAARTGLYDLRAGAWSQRLMQLADLSEERLGCIAAAGEVVDRVARASADQLGLHPRCVYVSGGWDQACAALGCGAVREGIVVNSMGSTDSLNATYRGIHTSQAMLDCRFTCTPAAVAGLYCTNAFSLSGGNLLAWFRDHLDAERAKRLAGEGRDYFTQLIEEAVHSRHPALVLAHFAGSGTPYMDADSRGAVLGLSLASEKADIARGVVEGIALEMAQNLEALGRSGIPAESIHAGGGGARNRRILQMRADAFNRPLVPLEVEEAGCLACGMLAARALDPSLRLEQLARSWVRRGSPVMPRPEQAARLARKREIHARLYPALRELNHLIAELQDS